MFKKVLNTVLVGGRYLMAEQIGDFLVVSEVLETEGWVEIFQIDPGYWTDGRESWEFIAAQLQLQGFTYEAAWKAACSWVKYKNRR